MKEVNQEHLIKKLLLNSSHKSRLWAALAALCVGTTLLLLSVTIWWDFNELLYSKNGNDAVGSTFMVIGKKVTEQNMGKPNQTVFTKEEIEALKHAPEVEEVGIITSNKFPVYAMMGGNLAFATEMPLESVPDSFIDKLPPDWKWEPGSNNLPIILSSQFLDIYNYVFAPSQKLPQLSERSVMSLSIRLQAGDEKNRETLMAHVVGFSDRIGSVLVPQSFIDYGNQKFNISANITAPSQLILRTKDPSDSKFTAYLEQHDYTTNSQNLRWSKIRAIVEIVTSATGILALLLMSISTLVFVLFIELTIVRAQQSLMLLQQIGYSPKYLTKYMIAHFIPLVTAAIALSMSIAVIIQMVAATQIKNQGLILSYLPGYPVWGALVISSIILIALISRSISLAIKKQ